MKLIILPKEDGLLKESPNYVLGIIMLTEKENGALCEDYFGSPHKHKTHA